MKCLLLIDNRVNDMSTVIESLNDNTNYIIVDYDNDTYDTIINKIGKTTTYDNVGIFEENYALDYYQFVNAFEKSILEIVEETDNRLVSWYQYKQLLSYFKNVLMASNIDLMGCSIHNNRDWNFVIENLKNQIGININSSIDNTGNAELGGNWILESNNKNLIGLYFTENINKYKFVLGMLNSHSAFLMSNGRVHMCGLNNYGQIGNGNKETQLYPVPVINVDGSYLENIVQISTGYFFTICLSNIGKVYAFGRNEYGQFGNNSITDKLYPVPTVINDKGIYLDTIVQVSAGLYHTLFLEKSGNVLSTGLNSGRLGNGSLNRSRIPVQVKKQDNTILTNIIQVSAGFDHSLFLSSSGVVYACGPGNTNYGQLGNGTNVRSIFAVLVIKENGLPLTDIIKISAGYYFSLFLTSTGTVYACGLNNGGRFGRALINSQYLYPVQVIKKDETPLTNIKLISAGFQNSIFLYNEGQAFTCGINNMGQLGNGNQIEEGENTVYLTNIVQVNTGVNNSFFLLENRNVYTCGNNNNGQLANGTIDPPVNPSLVKNNNLNINIDDKLNYIYSINDYNEKYYLLKNTNGVSNTNVNYSINDLLIFGVSVLALKSSPYNFTDSDILNSTNVPLFKKSWFEGYYTIEQIIAVYSPYQLYYIGYTILEIYNNYITYNYSAEKLLYESGFNLSFLLTSINAYTLTRLLAQQYGIVLSLLGITPPSTPNYVYTIQDLLTTNNRTDRKLTIPDFVNGGVKIKYLYDNSISIETLLQSFSVLDLLTTSTNELNSDKKLTVPQFIQEDQDLYTIPFFVANFVTILYLFTHGVSIQELLQSFSVLELLTTSTNEINSDKKLTVPQFIQQNQDIYTIPFFVDNFVTIQYLVSHGVSMQDLLNVYSTIDLITTNNGLDGKLTISQLLGLGVTIRKIVEDGTPIRTLLNEPNNYTINDLYDYNGNNGKLTIAELRLNEITFKELVNSNANISISDILNSFYSIHDILSHNTGDENSNFTINELLSYDITIKRIIESFKNVGINIFDLLNTPYYNLTISNLLTTNNGIDGRLTIRELINGGIKLQQLVSPPINISITTLRNQPNNFNLVDSIDRKYDLLSSKNGDGKLTVRQLLKININDPDTGKFTIDDFSYFYYDIQFLIRNGITFRELRFNFGINILSFLNDPYFYLLRDILTTNGGLDGKFTFKEIVSDGFIFNDFFPPTNDFVISDLLTSQSGDGKYTFKELNGYGVSISYFLENYDLTELVSSNGGRDGKYTFKELFDNGNGVPISEFLNDYSLPDLISLQNDDGKFTITDLIGNNITFTQLYNSYENKNTIVTILLTYYNLSQILTSVNGDGKLTVQNFIDDKFSLNFLISNNVTFKYLINNGVLFTQLIGFPLFYKTDNLITTNNGLDGKFTIRELVGNFGITFKNLLNDGITVNTLINPPNSFEISELLTSNKGVDGKLTFNQLYLGGILISTLLSYTTNNSFLELIDGGILVTSLLGPPNNYSITYLFQNGVSFLKMLEDGVNVSSLLENYNITYLISNGISIDYFINNGYYNLLIANGVNISNIKLEVSTLLFLEFTKDYIFGLEDETFKKVYTNFELLKGGFTTNDLLLRGINGLTPTNSDELLFALNSEFTNIYINQDLSIDFKNIVTGNHILKKITNISNKITRIIYV